MTTDNRTQHYNLPLPDASNSMVVDVGRIAAAISGIDTAVHAVAQDVASVGDTLALVATTGSYNDLSDKPTIPAAYTLPIASPTVLGGVKIGAGLSKAADGTVSVSASGGSVYDSVRLTPTTDGQTVFTVAGGYVPQAIVLYRNGVRLTGGGVSYTATDGNTITLNTGLSLTEWLDLDRLSSFSVADAVTSVNGKTPTGGAVVLTATDIGAATPADVAAASVPLSQLHAIALCF